MKKIYILSLVGLFLLTISIAASCQATPQDNFVVNKNDNKLHELIEQTANPEYLYKAPSTYAHSLKSANGLFNVDIDATVIIPNMKMAPTVRVEPAQITQEMANDIIAAFFADNPLYKPKTDADKTKEEIENEIIVLKVGDTDLGQYDRDAYDEMVAPEIKRLEEQLIDAPDNYTPEKSEGLFERPYFDEFTYMDKTIRHLLLDDNIEKIDVQAEDLNGKQARLTIERSSNNRAAFEYYQQREGEEYLAGESISMPIEAVNPDSLPSISLDEAKTLAQETINRVGLNDFQIADYGVALSGALAPLDVSYEDYPKCYVIYFTKNYDYPVNYVSNKVISDYSASWNNEVCSVYVDNLGIARVVYESPSKEIEKLNDSIELMPFKEIMKKFEEQILINGATFQQQMPIEYQSLKIEKIELGLGRIKENEDFSQCLYVPVWDFYGQWTTKYKDENEFTEKELGHSYLTINAIDGSIIDRSLGY